MIPDWHFQGIERVLQGIVGIDLIDFPQKCINARLTGVSQNNKLYPFKRRERGGLKRTFRQTKQLFFITEKVDKTHSRVVVAGPRTCQSLEAVQLEDVRFQHLNP